MFDELPDRYEEKRSIGARLLVPGIAAVGVVGIGTLAFVLLRPSGSPVARPHQEPHITQIQLPPPPPPPPLKPPPPTPQKLVEKPKEQVASPHRASVPKAAPKAPSPPAAVTTSITGPGPGSLAAGNGGGGDCIGSGCGTGDGGGGGDNDAYYSNVIQSQMLAALRQDDKLRYARYRARAIVVLDASGHIASETIQDFSGDPDIEQEVKRVLRTIGTNDIPPAEMIGRPFTVNITEHA